MDPQDPRHGTYSGAQAHWRGGTTPCEPCLVSVRRYQKRRKYDKARGIEARVDATAARAHLQRLNAAGMTDGAIASRAGVSLTAIRWTRVHLNDRILASTESAILGVELNPHPEGWVDSTGSRRRIQALATLGWSRPEIAATATELGYPLTFSVLAWVGTERSKGCVRVQTRDAITAAYDHLSMRFAPDGRSATQTRTTARKRGWPPPLAWDDIDTDPEPPTTNWQRAEDDWIAELYDLDGQRAGVSEVCNRLGVTRKSLQKRCERHDLTPLYSRMVDRESMRYWRNGTAEGGAA